MRLARLLVPVAAAALAAAALVGCSTSDASTPARYNLTVNMIGMQPHVGQGLELRVVHDATEVEVGYARVWPISATSFQVAVPDILILGERYYVDFYADFNRNGRYDAPPADHAWRLWINAVGGPTTLTFTHNANFTDIDFPPRP